MLRGLANLVGRTPGAGELRRCGGYRCWPVQVTVFEDRYGDGELRVEYNGGCSVTVFAGPEAERRARKFAGLKSGQLRTIRESLTDKR
jgi:hypothetical protein